MFLSGVGLSLCMSTVCVHVSIAIKLHMQADWTDLHEILPDV